MFAKTLPEKERKKFIAGLDPKTRKQVEKGLAEQAARVTKKAAVEEDEEIEEEEEL